MEGEQFSLSWNNFHTNLSTGFHSLLKNEDLVDVTLAAAGKFIKAHKTVLSVCSPFFKELFGANPNKHPIVILPDISYNALRHLLQFMYQGEVSVSQEEIPMFMRVAQILKIQGLGDYNGPSLEQPLNSSVEVNCNLDRGYTDIEAKEEPIDDNDDDKSNTGMKLEETTTWDFEGGESSQGHSRTNLETTQELSMPAHESADIADFRDVSMADSYLNLENLLNKAHPNAPSTDGVLELDQQGTEPLEIESDSLFEEFKYQHEFECKQDKNDVEGWVNEVTEGKRKLWKRNGSSKWKKNLYKIQRIEAKKPRLINCDNCRYTCTSHFSEEMRISICNFFWKCDYIRQKDFILRNTESSPPARRRARTECRIKLRKDSKIYYFHSGSKRVRVCKDYFIKTLCISSNVIDTAYKGKGEGGMFTGNDGRGGHRHK